MRPSLVANSIEAVFPFPPSVPAMLPPDQIVGTPEIRVHRLQKGIAVCAIHGRLKLGPQTTWMRAGGNREVRCIGGSVHRNVVEPPLKFS